MLIGTFYLDIPKSLPVLNATSFYFVAFAFLVFCLTRPFRSFLRPYVLLVANIVFLYSFSFEYLMIALCCGVITYLFGIILDRVRNKWMLFVLIGIEVYYLMSYKYSFLSFKDSLVMPLGLSFYTFKNISYMIDVYKGKQKVVINPLYYLDYTLFFPCIIAGPINRCDEFIEELNEKEPFEYKDAKNGGIQLLLGIFEKIVLCDYVRLVSNGLLDNVNVEGMGVLLGMILYSLTIYLDFDSYSNIAIGTARLLGFHLDKNFNSPYLAVNIKDFWNRWHISLSTWLKDYIYIPLGGSRKGEIRKYINIMIVFLVSGIWHGNTVNFIVWGALHGLLRIAEEPIDKAINKLDFSRLGMICLNLLRMTINFMLVTFLWLIFKYNTMAEVFEVIKRLLMPGVVDLTLIELTTMQITWLKVVIGIVVVTDIIRSNIDALDFLAGQFIIFRWMFYTLLIVVFLIFGVYGGSYDPNDFIYRGF